MTKISIAMAAYNGSRFLNQQLASLACQSKQPFEVVVCDDGSTDTTVEMLTLWAASVAFPVHIHQNAQRLGHEDNFLKAASLCTGDLIAFCDQDDVWMENKLQVCCDAFLDKEVTLALHSGKVVDTELATLKTKFPNIKRLRVAQPLRVDAYHAAPGFAMVFRSDLLRNCNLQRRPHDHLSADLIIGHDHLAYLIGSILGKVAFIPDCLVLHRRHHYNTTGAFRRSRKQFVTDALSAGSESYLYLADRTTEYADYLHWMSRTETELVSDAYGKGASHYYALAKLYKRRAYAHCKTESWAKRLQVFASMLIGGDYQQKTKGGLGARSLVKDVCFLMRL